MPTQLTPEIINAAIAGFEQQKRQLDDRISELRAMLPSGDRNGATSEGVSPKRRRISAAARRRMAQGQKAGWAKVRSEAQQSPRRDRTVKAGGWDEAARAKNAGSAKRASVKMAVSAVLACANRRRRRQS